MTQLYNSYINIYYYYFYVPLFYSEISIKIIKITFNHYFDGIHRCFVFK